MKLFCDTYFLQRVVPRVLSAKMAADGDQAAGVTVISTRTGRYDILRLAFVPTLPER